MTVTPITEAMRRRGVAPLDPSPAGIPAADIDMPPMPPATPDEVITALSTMNVILQREVLRQREVIESLRHHPSNHGRVDL